MTRYGVEEKDEGAAMIGSGIERPLSLLGVDMDRPNAARMHDYWLGGSHNFAADRDLCHRIGDLLPEGREAIWSNRAFLRRVVQYLAADRGIRQFIDLGSGIPTAGNVHEIAQRVDPAARVAYVDSDPIAVSHARHILTGTDHCVAIHADLRRPDDVFDGTELRRVIDLDQPVALTLFSSLGFVAGSERARAMLDAYVARLARGSYLAASQSAEYRRSPVAQNRALREYQQAIGVTMTTRSRDEIAGCFAGLELSAPGVVLIDQWRPDAQTPDHTIPFYGAVACVPG